MGEVYLAVDQRLGSAIAIKRTFFTEDELLGGAFEREARTLARLRHPVLPKVSDHFTENEIQYLVMEHISGDDLSKRLESNKKPFPINWVLFWADQLLDALNYLHSHEPPIIHRDIKPQNLKLTSDNQIVLLDFGLAKDSVGQTKITTTGSVVGFTPHYAPMEQIRGTGTNPKSDIYSLSTTLYQLLTNTVPFDALSRADSLLNGVPDPVQPINEINKEVPKPISDIIIKGMSVSQEQRYGNAREMQKTLRDAYTSMQSQMSAQTVAFNMQEELNPGEIPPGQSLPDNYATMINEPFPIGELNSQPAAVSDNPPGSVNADNLKQAETPVNEAPPDFDATMRMDEFPVLDSEPKQSDIKTEVFIKDGSTDLREVEKTEDKSAEESSAISPDETFPLISYDSQPRREPVEKHDSVPTHFYEKEQDSVDAEDFTSSEDGASEQPDFLKTEYIPDGEKSLPKDDYTASGAADRQQFVSEKPNYENVNRVPPPVKKKSGGKGLAIGAGLFALLILFAGAGFGGWYVYKNYVAVDNPPSTPKVSPSAETSPEPSMAETNTDNSNIEIVGTGDGNQNIENTGETNTDDGNKGTTANSSNLTTRPTPVKPTPRPTQVITQKTQRPTPPPVSKTPVPKSTPDRSKILKP